MKVAEIDRAAHIDAPSGRPTAFVDAVTDHRDHAGWIHVPREPLS